MDINILVSQPAYSNLSNESEIHLELSTAISFVKKSQSQILSIS